MFSLKSIISAALPPSGRARGSGDAEVVAALHLGLDPHLRNLGGEAQDVVQDSLLPVVHAFVHGLRFREFHGSEKGIVAFDTALHEIMDLRNAFELLHNVVLQPRDLRDALRPIEQVLDVDYVLLRLNGLSRGQRSISQMKQ